MLQKLPKITKIKLKIWIISNTIFTNRKVDIQQVFGNARKLIAVLITSILMIEKK